MYFTGYGVTVLWPVCLVVEPGTVPYGDGIRADRVLWKYTCAQAKKQVPEPVIHSTSEFFFVLK
jgi:hypothetical protein